MRKVRMKRRNMKLYAPKKHIQPAMIVMPLLILMLLVSIVVYDNSRVTVDEIRFSMPALPREMESTRLLQVSDLRGRTFGEDCETFGRALNGYKYDFVVMTGDLLGPGGDTEGLYQMLDFFRQEEKPVYFITGDRDLPATGLRGDGSYGPSDWVQGAIDRGAVYLDVPMVLREGDSDLWLMPASALALDPQSAIDSLDARLDDGNLDDATVQTMLYKKERTQAFADAMEARCQNDLTVMLTHMPCLDADLQPESSTEIFGMADLILAGHHVGGQFCLPFFGGIRAENDLLPRNGWFPEEKYLTGLHEVNAVHQYVSTGIGTQWEGALNFRLLNPPQVSVITLTRNVET